jgi:hypothetical protein
MPSIVVDFLGTLLRHFFTYLGSYLIAKGLFTHEQMDVYIGAAVTAILGAGWALWVKYKDKILLRLAQATPHTITESELKKKAETTSVSIAVDKHEVPTTESKQ